MMCPVSAAPKVSRRPNARQRSCAAGSWVGRLRCARAGVHASGGAESALGGTPERVRARGELSPRSTELKLLSISSPMYTPLAMCLAATALVAQTSTVIDPRLAGVLEPNVAAQFLLPIQGFAVAQLAYSPVPHPALRVAGTTVYAPDPLLCSANHAGAEVAQIVFAMPGVILLLDASPSLALLKDGALVSGVFPGRAARAPVQ